MGGWPPYQNMHDPSLVGMMYIYFSASIYSDFCNTEIVSLINTNSLNRLMAEIKFPRRSQDTELFW